VPTATDERFIGEAIALSLRGAGTVAPSPLVGCVIVRDGVIVGSGYHGRWGGPHAEAEALRDAGDAARGATLYVTLEPCTHYGKTPPCSRAVLDAGVRRVVIAVRDPSPIGGGGADELRTAGVEVTVGVCGPEAVLANAAYLKWRLTGLPLVHVKVAATVDGRVSGPTGLDERITGGESCAQVHRMRFESSAVLTGVGTVLADDPLLTARLPGGELERQPLRVVLDRSGRIPATARVLASAAENGPVLWCVAEGATPQLPGEAWGAHVDVVTCPARGSGLDLEWILRHLAERDVTSVLVEAGPKLSTSFVRERLADRLTLFLAPRLMGGQGLPILDSLGLATAEDAPTLERCSWSAVGDDMRLDAWLPGLEWPALAIA